MAFTTSSTSSVMNRFDPVLASLRCTRRYCELRYGSSTASVYTLPAASLSSERTSDVTMPAVLYAVDPISGMALFSVPFLLAVQFDPAHRRRDLQFHALLLGDLPQRVIEMRQVIHRHIAHERPVDF